MVIARSSRARASFVPDLTAIGRPRDERRSIVVDAQVVPARRLGREPEAETSPFARYLRSPRHFRQCREARHRQILYGSDVSNGLSPDRWFDSKDVLFGDAGQVDR